MLRLTYSKVLICSVSTFCLWPAITNNNTAYFPVTKLITKEDLSFDYGTSFHWMKDLQDRSFLGVRAVSVSNAQLVASLSSD